MGSSTKKQDWDDREKAIMEMADGTLGREGELEFDQYCAVSEGDDNGAYVQAWVWVPFDGTALCKGDGGSHDKCSDGCPVLDKMLDKAS